MQESIAKRQKEVEDERKRLQLEEEKLKLDKRQVENVQAAYVESRGMM